MHIRTRGEESGVRLRLRLRMRSSLCLSLLCLLFFVIEFTSALYWSQLNTTLYYGQRVRHRIAYNRGTQTLVLTGGFSYPGTTRVDTGNQSSIVASLSKQRIPALDVWISRDGGITWTNTTSSPSFGVRLGHTSLVSYGETFVMGGQTQLINKSGVFYQPTNDIYKSSDYVNWQRVSLPDSGSRFPPRYGHATAFDEVNSIMYIIGGQTNNLVYLNDVWRSEDRGVNWFQKTSKALFAPRAGHSSGFISNTLYVVGGADANTAYSDLWRSYDGGSTWSSISQTALPWSGRTLHTSIVYGPVIMLIGGCNKDLTTGFLNEIWMSTDAGNTWVKEIQPPPFSKRAGAAGAIIDNQVLLVGGYNVTNFIPTSVSDTWTTTLPRNPTNSDGAIVAAIFGIIVLFVGLTYWVWINARRNGLFGMKVNKDRWVQDEQQQHEESEIPEPQADEEEALDVDDDEHEAR